MPSVRVHVDDDGRIVIPAEYLQALDIRIGEAVILTLAEDELRVHTIRSAIKRAQDLVRQYVPEGRSLSDELIADRRAEVARESTE